MTAYLRKEIRALAPTWLASIVAVGATAFADPNFLMLGMMASGLGAVTLGAQSIGHEYTHRTFGVLLAQPVDRRRVLLTKIAVLIVMLGLLAAVAWLALVNYAGFSRLRNSEGPELFSLVALCALCLAPWLTMLSRSALAGTVFTIAVPGVLWTSTEIVGIWQYGLGRRPEGASFQLALFTYALLGLCAVAAIATWRMFVRLEVIEGRGSDVQLPGWLRASTGRAADRPATQSSHPVWLLVKKELRLQQMTFVVVALFVVAWAAAVLFAESGRGVDALVRGPLTALYFGLVSILIGALASAEERHLGTHAWQVLLPMAAWKQWLVKAGTAVGLALLVGIVLPVVLHYTNPSPNDALNVRRGLSIVLAAGGVTALTSASLYLSSLCNSGVRALVLALPVGIVGVLIFNTVDAALWRFVYRVFGGTSASFRSRHAATIGFVTDYMVLVLAASFIALLLTLAFRNHWTLDRGIARVVRQTALLVGFVVLGQVLVAGVWVAYTR